MHNIEKNDSINNLSDSFSIFTIDDSKLAVRQTEVFSIETILDLKPVEFSFETDCVSTISTDSMTIPIFSINQHLVCISNFPMKRRACLILKTDNKQAYGILVDTINTHNKRDSVINQLPDYMLTKDSMIKEILETDSKMVSIIDNTLLAEQLKVNEFY